MAQANKAETLDRASDFGTDFATATIKIKAGANVLATHTLAGFTFSNDPDVENPTDDGLATAEEIADVAITGLGVQTADGAEMTAGSKTYSLSVADLNLSTTTYVNGETSSINSLVVRFKA